MCAHVILIFNTVILIDMPIYCKLWEENKYILSYLIFYIACLTECKECQAFCLFAWIGPPHPQASVAPPLWVQEGRHTRLWGRAWRDPIPTKGQTLWYSMFTINFYICLFGDIRNSIHEKSHGIPWNSAEFHGIIRHGIRRNSAGIAANSARNTE